MKSWDCWHLKFVNRVAPKKCNAIIFIEKGMEEEAETTARNSIKKARLSIHDFKFQSTKQLVGEHSFSKNRRSHPNLGFLKRNSHQEENTPPIEKLQREGLPPINKIQNFEPNFQSEGSQKNISKELNTRKRRILKNPTLDNKQKPGEIVKEDDSQPIPYTKNQKMFWIQNLDMGSFEEQGKKELMNKIVVKVKDVERRRRDNLQHIFKRISDGPDELKTKSVKFHYERNPEKKTFHLAPKIPSPKVIKQENFVTGWNIRVSNPGETIENFYALHHHQYD